MDSLENLNVLRLSQGVLLAVLASPLAGALLTVWLGKRVALLFAPLHVGLTAAFVALCVGGLLDRGQDGPHRAGPGLTDQLQFLPLAVPGDSGRAGQLDAQSHATTWGLLSLGPTTPGVPAPEIQFFVGVDGLNVWLILLTSLMTYVAVLTSWGRVKERAATYYAWIFALQTAVLGAFMAFDVILFYVFFELTLIPTFFLVGNWGVGRARRDAAKLFFLYTLLGSLFTLVGLVGVVVSNPTPLSPVSAKPTPIYSPVQQPSGEVLFPKEGPVTFSIPKLMMNVTTWEGCRKVRAEVAAKRSADADSRLVEARANLLPKPTDPELLQKVTFAAGVAEAAAADLVKADGERAGGRTLELWLFLALMAGFAVKIPLVPFHTWLPTVYNEAPIAVTLLLAAVLSKLGTYGVLRIVLPLVPEAAVEYGLEVFGLLGAVGIVYGALCAFAQKDLKLLTAYSSVSHLGLLALALFSFNTEGLAGASLHMLNHGLATGAMFALLGYLYHRYGTLDMSQYGGLIARHPGFAFLLVLVALANVGLPFLNNFVSEMLILAGLFEPSVTGPLGYTLGAVAASGIFLSAWYTFTMLRRVLFGPALTPRPLDGVAVAMSAPERMSYLVPTVLCVVLGVYPQLVLDSIKGDTATVAQHGDVARLFLDRPPSARMTHEVLPLSTSEPTNGPPDASKPKAPAPKLRAKADPNAPKKLMPAGSPAPKGFPAKTQPQS